MTERPRILENWDEVQHEPVSLPPDDFTDLELGDAVDLIRDWFFYNFEDPAHSTPYESAEGGYQYIWGGPYDTRDIIENIFADTATEDLITAAIHSIDADGMEWVPSTRRRLPPDEDEFELPEDPSILHAAMLSRIRELETILEETKAVPGIGHNHPPDIIEVPSLSAQDAEEIKVLLATLKQQPIEPTDNGKAARSAVDGLREKAGRFRDFIAVETAKEVVKYGAGGMLVLLGPKIESVISAALKWISSLLLGS